MSHNLPIATDLRHFGTVWALVTSGLILLLGNLEADMLTQSRLAKVVVELQLIDDF